MSFPAETEVLTPKGKVVIEDLSEGDMVVARHEITGELGAFPVTALMARQAPGIIWLTLEGAETRVGLTAEHTLFVAGAGWTRAEDIRPEDRLRNADLAELTVLSVEDDANARRVHNLEIGDAHTYFVGDLEVWGHSIVKDPPTWIYRKYDKDGNFLKTGISCNPDRRHTKKQLNGGYPKKVRDPMPRWQALAVERVMVMACPGPENREPWARNRR